LNININKWPVNDKNRLDAFLKWNGYLSHRHKLLYVATPKVACTTIKWWFASLEGCTDKIRESFVESSETDPELLIHDVFFRVAPHVTGLPLLNHAEAFGSDDYFTFALVRNPYKRIFSAWQSKLLLQEPLQATPYLKCPFYHLPINTAADIRNAFECFLEHLAENESPIYWDYHWTPQKDLLRPDLIPYSKLAKIEEYETLNQELKTWLGADIPGPFEGRRTNESLIPYLPELVTERSVELIRKLYAQDFETFGYDTCLPVSKTVFNEDHYGIVIKAVKLIRARHQRFAERSRHITGLRQEVEERDSQISSLRQEVEERDSQISSLQQEVEKRDSQISSLQQEVEKRDSQISSLHLQLHQILTSNSWKLMQPMRHLRHLLTRKNGVTWRSTFSFAAHKAWASLPISTVRKQQLKKLIFTTASPIFKNTGVYQNWVKTQQSIERNEPNRLERSEDDYVPLTCCEPPKNNPVKLICFYLPQFHPIPENDTWWGEGFTEWTNVQPARPQFEGHYQPRIPGELGYYDLLDPGVQKRQIELAKRYGIGGFCFYFYWFAGKRLLETPIENYLQNSSLDLPFCLCWANENWSRRWDGLDSQILIAQQHSPEDDLAFIEHVAIYMRDERYIRIDGKPLLVVYRPNLLPSASKTAARWRQWCKKNGIGEIYLAYTQSFEAVDPSTYGFDAAIEFPPNNSAPPIITDSVTPLNDDFDCTVYDWRIFVERSKNYQKPTYTLFRGICPSWDNTARRKNKSAVFINNTPRLYQCWLENAIKDTLENQTNPDERLIFANAWNEWAEGAYLEPDARYGYAWLQATRNALEKTPFIPEAQRKILLVAHDAYPHGAQMLVANLAKTLNQGMGFQVDLVCLGDGPLLEEYAKWATVHPLAGKDAQGPEAITLAEKLFNSGHRKALVNTTVCGLFLETLVHQGMACVALIHELRGVIDQYQLYDHANAIATHARKVVFPAAEVAEQFNEVAPVPPDKLVLRPQGLYKRLQNTKNSESSPKKLRRKLNLPETSRIVLGVGFADHRKGIDLFVAAGIAMAPRLADTFWVWIGHWDKTMQYKVEKQINAHPELKDRFVFPGLQKDTDLFYAGADVFALTSREDPFPSVVLEAMQAGLPVVGFEGTGGCAGLLREGCGRLAERENAVAFGEAVMSLLEHPENARMAGQYGSDVVAERFSFRHYVYDLLDLLGLGLDRISVVVPNYNYAQYLPERLNSILKQDYPIFEILFLDDLSTDESLDVANKILAGQDIDYRIISNDENSGSVFKQWKKGVDLARGTHVWIAEADDSCSENFVSETRKGFRTPGVVLSYSESSQIDEDGNFLAQNYLYYVSDVDPHRWLTPFVLDGHQAAAEIFCIKNTIPNVSAVIFDSACLRNVLHLNQERILSYRLAGDWLVYVELLKYGSIAFTPVPANIHRRHQNSVTLASFGAKHLDEIRKMQAYVTTDFFVSKEKSEAAHTYLKKLARQFDIL
jgi:glycosyltransferase involved in cell wall biosynthesis